MGLEWGQGRGADRPVGVGCAGHDRETARLLRMVQICDDSAVTVELSLKAPAILHSIHPPSENELKRAGHDIDRCLRLIPPGPRSTAERQVRERGLDLATMSTWRARSTDGDDASAAWGSADDRVEDYVWTAPAVRDHTFEQVSEAVGDTPAEAAARAALHRRASRTSRVDVRAGEPRHTD